jgi:hypothetical protein
VLNRTNVQVTARTEHRQRMHFVRTVISYVYMEQLLPKGGSGKLSAELDLTRNTRLKTWKLQKISLVLKGGGGLNMYVRSAVDLSPATRN